MDKNRRTRPSAAEIAESLRQTESVSQRRMGIVTFAKALRDPSLFQPTWDAIGGAHGLAETMSHFSVRDVHAMCAWLGRGASNEKVVDERRTAMSELVRILVAGTYDSRPLKVHYRGVVLACTFDMVETFETEWGVGWTNSQKKRLYLAHREDYEMRFLRKLVSPEGVSFRENVILFQGKHRDYCETVLSAIAAYDGHIQDDFMEAFAMPLIKRLARRHGLRDRRIKFVGLVTDCLVKHSDDMGGHIDLQPGQFIHDHLLRHYHAGSNPWVEENLVRLLPLVSSHDQERVRKVFDAAMVPKKKSNKRKTTPPPYDPYPLFRFLLLHLKSWRLDISSDSAATMARLRKLTARSDPWPLALFRSTDPITALALLDRLDKVDTTGSFMEIPSGRTLFNQPNAYPNGQGDVEVLRAFLQARLRDDGDRPWLKRTRELIEKRKDKATVSREQQPRAFWAKSALGLCVASGDLETLAENLVWARRFHKDSYTIRQVFLHFGIITPQLEDLLAVVPRDDEHAARLSPDSVREDMATANRIAVDFARVFAAAASEPGFGPSDWIPLPDVSRTIADRRVCGSGILKATFGTDAEMNEAVWKPLITSFFDIEDHIGPVIGHSRYRIDPPSTRAASLITNLGQRSPEAMADLATFTVETMRTRLSPEALRTRTSDVVSIMMFLARGDNPGLACPFIRDAVANGSGEDSSWHRQMVTTHFLSSLPAATAREFLYSISGGIKDLMKTQNARPRDPDTGEAAAKAPLVKVTTIKMMAQTLGSNIYLDPLSSANLLISLLEEARHIDARITLVNSLINILKDPTCAPTLRQRVFEALETTVVPVAARVNERFPVKHDEWEAVPVVGDETPLFSMLVERASSDNLSADDRERFTHIFMDILAQSIANNERWMRAFLAKHDFAVDALPPSPVSPEILPRILSKFGEFLPASFIGMMKTIALANLDPPADVARITELVKEDRELETSNAGEHWLRVFGDSGNRVFTLGLSDVTGALLRTPDEPARRHISDADLLSFILEAAESMIAQGKPDLLDSLVHDLSYRRTWAKNDHDAWRERGVPVVQQIVDLIHAARDHPDRPSVLPNTFRIKTKLLPMPFSDTDKPSTGEERDAFADALASHIGDLATRVPYHADFQQLKNDLGCVPLQELAYAAVRLARCDDAMADENPTLAAYLRMELAADFLERASDPGEAVAGEVRAAVGAWKTCRVEGLRVMGQEVEDKMKGIHDHWYMARSEYPVRSKE